MKDDAERPDISSWCKCFFWGTVKKIRMCFHWRLPSTDCIATQHSRWGFEFHNSFVGVKETVDCQECFGLVNEYSLWSQITYH